MMKRYCIFAVLMLLTQLVSAADEVLIDGIYYNLDDKKKVAEVTHAPNYEEMLEDSRELSYYQGTVNIPESVTYGGVSYSVTSIGEEAFAYNVRLKEVGLPASLTAIGTNAFCCCNDLESVFIPKLVDDIRPYAFNSCI